MSQRRRRAAKQAPVPLPGPALSRAALIGAKPPQKILIVIRCDNCGAKFVMPYMADPNLVPEGLSGFMILGVCSKCLAKEAAKIQAAGDNGKSPIAKVVGSE